MVIAWCVRGILFNRVHYQAYLRYVERVRATPFMCATSCSRGGGIYVSGNVSSVLLVSRQLGSTLKLVAGA